MWRRDEGFRYRITHLGGHRIAILLDPKSSDRPSFEDVAAEVAKALGVDYVIWRDREGVWRFWDKKEGERDLSVGGEPTTMQEIAQAVAAARYLR